jgi:nitrogen-specific signal transduction histidine kinase
MNYYALMPLFSAMTHLFLWTFVLVLHNKSTPRRVYLIFVAMSGLWAFMDFLIWNHTNPATQYMLLRMSSVLWIPLTSLYLLFAYRLVHRKPDWLLYGIGVVTAFFAMAGLFTAGVVAGVESRHWGAAAVEGPLFYPTILLCVILPGVLSIHRVASRALQIQGMERRQLLFFLSGIALTWGLVLFINIGIGQLLSIEEIPMLGSTLICIQTGVVFIASTRYRFLNVGVQEIAMDIFSRSSDGVVLLNHNGWIVEINDAARKLLNISPRKTTSTFIEDLISPPYRFNANCENKEILFEQGRHQTPQVGLLSQCDFYQGKIWSGKLVTIRNITALKAAEEAQGVQRKLQEKLRKNQEMKMLALGELAGEIVHNVNNLMGGIVGYTSILRNKLRDNPEAKPLLDGIQRAVKNAASMGEELLRFTQSGEMTGEKVDVHSALEHSISLAKHSFREKIEFSVKLSSERHQVMGTMADLENLFLNLFINARDAMPEGGTLSVSTENADTDIGNGKLSAERGVSADVIQIVVQDSGTGIDPEIMDRVFEPFFTTRKDRGGTGLGLSNAFGIVKKLNGHICVDSYPGQGATFIITLPTVSPG